MPPFKGIAPTLSNIEIPYYSAMKMKESLPFVTM